MSRACFETSGNGLADVIQCLGLRASLGDATRNGRALCNEHASLVGLERHEQLHTWILLYCAPNDGPQQGHARGLLKLVRFALFRLK